MDNKEGYRSDDDISTADEDGDNNNDNNCCHEIQGRTGLKADFTACPDGLCKWNENIFASFLCFAQTGIRLRYQVAIALCG